MEQQAFINALSNALPDAIIYHYKPACEQILESLTDYKAGSALNQNPNDFSEEYLSNNDFLTDFCGLVYSNIDDSVSSADIAHKIETITATSDMLIGCLERIEEFADKTGEFATQNKITRRLLQNVMSFIFYSLSQIAKLDSGLEKALLEKSESALIPFGFGE